MSPLVKYWTSVFIGFLFVGASSVLMNNAISGRRFALEIPLVCGLAFLGANLYFWGANWIGRCPVCHTWIKNRITWVGFLPDRHCRVCGRDLLAIHASGDRSGGKRQPE